MYSGDSEPNMPIYKVAEAMEKPLVIRGAGGEFEVLSYYCDGTNMVIDIQERST
jgi:hypothetical protein